MKKVWIGITLICVASWQMPSAWCMKGKEKENQGGSTSGVGSKEGGAGAGVGFSKSSENIDPEALRFREIYQKFTKGGLNSITVDELKELMTGGRSLPVITKEQYKQLSNEYKVLYEVSWDNYAIPKQKDDTITYDKSSFVYLKANINAGHRSNNPWQVLGISEIATDSEATQAFNKLSFCLHPDRIQASGLTIDEANNLSQKLSWAKSILTDADQRKKWEKENEAEEYKKLFGPTPKNYGLMGLTGLDNKPASFLEIYKIHTISSYRSLLSHEIEGVLLAALGTYVAKPLLRTKFIQKILSFGQDDEDPEFTALIQNNMRLKQENDLLDTQMLHQQIAIQELKTLKKELETERLIKSLEKKHNNKTELETEN